MQTKKHRLRRRPLQLRFLRQHRRNQIAEVVRRNDRANVPFRHHRAAPIEIRNRIKLRRCLPMTDPRIDKMKAMPFDAFERPAIVGIGTDDENVHLLGSVHEPTIAT